MTRPSWVVGAVLLLAIAAARSRCLAQIPSSRDGQEPKCDTEKTAVLGDGLLATAAGVTTLAVGADSGGAAIAPAILGAVFVAAAIHGNNAVNECRAAKAEYIASLQTPPPPAARGRFRRAHRVGTTRAADPDAPRARRRSFAAQLRRPPSRHPTRRTRCRLPAPAPAGTATRRYISTASHRRHAAPAPTWSAFWKEVH